MKIKIEEKTCSITESRTRTFMQIEKSEKRQSYFLNKNKKEKENGKHTMV
jgi:hypothetical protein